MPSIVISRGIIRLPYPPFGASVTCLRAALNDASPTKLSRTSPAFVIKCKVRCFGGGGGGASALGFGAAFGADFFAAVFFGAVFFGAAFFLGAAFAFAGFFVGAMISPLSGELSITGCCVLVFDTMLGGPIELSRLVLILPMNGPALGGIV